MLGLLYDLHGNLPALESILAEADDLGVDSWVLGGDYGIPSPWPLRDTRTARGAAERDVDPRLRTVDAEAFQHARSPGGVQSSMCSA